MEIIEKKSLTLAESFELLNDRKKEPLSFEQQYAYDYLDDVSRLSEKDAESLSEKLKPFGLNDIQLVKVVDLMPKKEDELKMILSSAGSGVSAEQLKEIVKIIKSFKEKEKSVDKIKKVKEESKKTEKEEKESAEN
jgi:DNA-directed RNA polymerase subunit F